MNDGPRPTQEQIAGQIGEMNRRLLAYFESKVAELGLTMPQAELLMVLETALPMHEIAGKRHCDASNVTGIVDRLEARGLVERRVRPNDRRIKEIVLTEEGERARRRVDGILSEVPGLSRMSEAERTDLFDLLARALADTP